MAGFPKDGRTERCVGNPVLVGSQGHPLGAKGVYLGPRASQDAQRAHCPGASRGMGVFWVCVTQTAYGHTRVFLLESFKKNRRMPSWARKGGKSSHEKWLRKLMSQNRQTCLDGTDEGRGLIPRLPSEVEVRLLGGLGIPDLHLRPRLASRWQPSRTRASGTSRERRTSFREPR